MTAKPKTQLPLIRLNLAMPFLEAATSAGGPTAEILEPHGLCPADFANKDKFVTAPAMYDVVEALATATGDPYAGANLGSALDPFSWSPLADAARNASSVGDLLLRFSIDAYRDASSAVFRLDTQGNRTTFTESRLHKGNQMPRHNDAFGTAYVLTILKSAVADEWDGRKVIVSVCEPGVFPPGHLNVRVARATNNEFSVSFPCEWLLLNPRLTPVDRHSLPIAESVAPGELLPALHLVLKAHLHESDLSSERVALLCGMSKRTLARRLAELGTSLKTELDALRLSQAQRSLREKNQSISGIARSIGYQDPSVFTRAFKRWSGVTPSAFREGKPINEH